MLDGVDEIAAASVAAYGNTPLQAIASRLQGWVASSQVVLTCRLNVRSANLNALENFETYRLLDFDYPSQVKQFIRRCFQKCDPDKGEQLWSELDKPARSRIQDLVKNPLRLALLCSTWHSSDRGLPDTKAGLYQHFVQEFYNWKENRFPTTEQQQQELNAALGRLAKRAIDSQASRFRLQHHLIREELGDPKQQTSLFWLALQLGWLNEVGLAAESVTKEKVYAFFHPTFQEYFAALAIDDWHDFLNHIPHNPAQGTYRIFEQQWKEVILLWLGRERVAKQQKEEFIKALVEFDDGCGGFYRFRAYFLAASALAEFRDSSRADEIVAQIVKWGFGYFNIEKQQSHNFIVLIAVGARAILPQTDNGRAINELINLLSTTSDEDTRRIPAESLGKIDPGNQQAIAASVRVLETTLDDDPRLIAAYSLWEIDPGNQQAIADLFQILSTNPDNFTRISGADSLGIGIIGSGNEWAITKLAGIMSTISDDDTGSSAAESLGEIGTGNEQAIAALVRILETTSDDYTRRRDAYSLGKIGTGNEQAIAVLLRILSKTSDVYTRLRAAYMLNEIMQNYQMSSVVSTLQHCLAHEVYEFNFDLFNTCYRVIWNCAQKMSYPAFYQAWHPTTDAQNFIFDNFPQILAKVINNEANLCKKVKLICLDGSKFIDRDNPASKIYTQLVKAGCSKCDDGTPKTMAYLQTYWELLSSNKQVILVFYESAAEPLTSYNSNI